MRNLLLALFMLFFCSGFVFASSNPKIIDLPTANRLDLEANGPLTRENVESICNEVAEKYKSSNIYDIETYWTGCWFNEGKRSVCGVRIINRKTWTATPLATRGIGTSWDACLREHNLRNGWMYDDICRDKLNMNSKELDHLTVIHKGNRPSKLKSGRYIFVLRQTQKYGLTLILRHYDRSIDFKDGGAKCDFGGYLYQKNIETVHRSFSPHVRHSQLNDGWDPVWSAGEMLIENGLISVVTNESGHFKPKGATLEFVRDAMSYFHLPVKNGYKLLSVEKDGGIDNLSYERRCTGGILHIPQPPEL